MPLINVADDREYAANRVLDVAAANSNDGLFLALRFTVPDGPPIVLELDPVQRDALDEVLAAARAERQQRT